MTLVGEEVAHIEKPNGDVAGPFRARFAGDIIIVEHAMLDVEIGDTVVRGSPTNASQRSRVTQCHFYSNGPGPLGPHYQLRVDQSNDRTSEDHLQRTAASGAQSSPDHADALIVLGAVELLARKIHASSASAELREEAITMLSTLMAHPAVLATLGKRASNSTSCE